MLISYYLSQFDYFQHPEGKDVIGKLVGANKWAMMASYVATTIDGAGYTRCMNIPEVLNCAAYWFVPLCGATTAFVSVNYALTNLRGKDDVFNYMISTVPAVGILHHCWWKRFPPGFSASVLLWATLAMGLIKQSYIEEVEWFPIVHTDTFHMSVPPLTFVEDRPRGSWVKYYD